jgi:trimeric autotransporter adhesin
MKAVRFGMLLVALAVLGLAGVGQVAAQPAPALTVCSMPNVPIPDSSVAGGPGSISDTISIADVSTLSDLNVYIRANHTWVGDLIFTLQHVPSGTTVTLIDRPGVPASTFGCSGDNYDVTVDDEGLDTPIENQCVAPPPAITGQAIGGDPPNASLLAAFDGLSIQGDWTLTVTDNATGDTGTLNEWCVIVTATPDPTPIPVMGGLGVLLLGAGLGLLGLLGFRRRA